MILKKAFDKLLCDRVNLNRTRIDRIISAHHSVREKLKEDEWISRYLVDSKLQGSYALRTAIRSPYKEGTYDVDVVLGLNLEGKYGELPSGISVLKNVQSALEQVSLYSGKTKILNCCIRIAYSSDGLDFHLDVVPAHVPDGMRDPLQIPRDWDKTNPLGYIDWFNETNRDGSGHLRWVVRLVKYWKELHELKSPNSMVLTTLAGQFLPEEALSVDDALVKVLGGMVAWADWHSVGEKLEVPNPSLPAENLARDWRYDEFTLFRDHLILAYEDATKARYSMDERETIDLWNGPHLFDGHFPTDLHIHEEKKYREVANDFRKGDLIVGKNGIVGGITGYKTSYNKGFYGSYIPGRHKPQTDLTLQRFAMKMKYPAFACQSKNNGIVLTGVLTPREASPQYQVQIILMPHKYPEVRVLSPQILKSAPHLWPNGSLCLFNPRDRKWKHQELIAQNLIAWASLWLYFYEGWLGTGIWFGPESPHGDEGKHSFNGAYD